MPTGRIFPSDSRLDVDSKFRSGVKTVDKSNAYSRFSARNTSSRVNETTLFDSPAPHAGGRSTSRTVRHSDPFDGARKDSAFNMPGKGLRVTGMEDMQRERSRQIEDNPRFHKRSVSTSATVVDNSYRVFTASGEPVKGRKPAAEYPQSQVLMPSNGASLEVSQQCARARSSDRFRNTPHSSTNHVLNPERMEASNRLSGRFSARSHTPSLQGVMYPIKESQPRPYRIQAPFHTDD